MSSTNVSSVLSQLLSEMKTLNGRISTLETLVSVKPSAAPASAGKAKKERKTKSSDSEPRAPTAWRLFADRVRGILREAGFEGKSLGTECVQFCASLKAENSEFSSWSEGDILARRAAWSAPEVSKQKAADMRKSPAASVVSEAADGAEAEKAKKARKNPWEGLSDEQKAERIAKMKAGKAAKKASEAPSAAAEEEAPASDGEAAPASVSSSEKKKRGPKKFSEMSPEEVAEAKAKRASKKESKGAASAAAKVPLPPSPPASVSSLEGFQRVMLSGAPYWVNLSSGHCYHRLTDGSQGDWAGIFSRTPKPHIDSSVAEPAAEDDDVLNLDE
jgi:hypothetical protein